MLIGYARVSTVGQDYISQKTILENEKCEKIFVERITITSTAPRKELKNVLEYIRKGDTLVVTKLDRLAQSIIDLNKIVTKLIKKGVNVKFVNENIEFKAEETNGIQLLLFNLLESLVQFERDLILERIAEGKVRAKSQGKHLGRPAQPENKIKEALDLYDKRIKNKLSVSDIAKVTGVPKSTIYNELKKNKGVNNS